MASCFTLLYFTHRGLRLFSARAFGSQRVRLVAVLAKHDVFDYVAPDFSTKEKAQKLAGVPLQKLVDEKLAFKSQLVQEWIKKAAAEGRLNMDSIKNMSDHASYTK